MIYYKRKTNKICVKTYAQVTKQKIYFKSVDTSKMLKSSIVTTTIYTIQ